MSFYAVAKGHQRGIFATWSECVEQVRGYSKALYKKCKTRQEAEVFVHAVETEDTFQWERYIYTDGACSNNGKPNAKAGYGIYFGPGDQRNVSRIVEGKPTNNVAELTAIREAIAFLDDNVPTVVVTDSEYAYRCVTTYGDYQAAQQWKNEIPNKELVRQVYEWYAPRRSTIRFLHVMAHTGDTDMHSVGNEAADRLAKQAIL